jgi:hypothetical protein
MKLFQDRNRVPARSEPGPGANEKPRNPRGPDRNPTHSLGNPFMVDELRKPGTIPRGAEPRSRPATAHSAHSALIQSLQGLRERVLERLDSLETLARQRSASAPVAGEIEGLERALELKLADLEETERRLSAQAERQEKDWSASLTQLEADRRLLAEAWERVERERIAYSSAAEPNHPSLAQGRVRPPAGLLAPAPGHGPLHRGRSDSDHPSPGRSSGNSNL